MKNQAAELTGEKFNMLTVLERAGSKNGKALWKCQCECGNAIYLTTDILKSGRQISCGCYRKSRNLKHGDCYERLYHIWNGMIGRCTHKSYPSYKHYGKNGVSVCDQWKEYESFKKWALENGYDDNLLIDRIDNGKGYSPDNCRFVTAKQQQNNKTNNHVLTFKGQRKTVCEWAEILNVNPQALFSRLKRGWTIERTLSEPIHLKGGVCH